MGQARRFSRIRRRHLVAAVAAIAGVLIAGTLAFAIVRQHDRPATASITPTAHLGSLPSSEIASPAPSVLPATPSFSPALGSAASALAAPFVPPVGRIPSASSVLGYDGGKGYPLLVTNEINEPNIPGQSTSVTTTWKWDGERWLVLAEDQSMVGSSRPVYDPLTRQSIAMAGCGTGCAQETWSWDGQHWSNLTPPTTPAVGVPSYLAFDPVHHVMILQAFTWSPYGSSTWLFDGTEWSKATTSVSPTPREESQMVYDPDTGTTVLYGGRERRDSTFLADTWTWDGRTWTQQHPATNPPAGFVQMAYDTKARRLVMLVEQITAGARTRLGPPTMAISSWSWDGRNWSSMPGNLPEPGFGAALTYDPGHDQLLFFEGTADSMSRASQTWVYANGSWQRRW